MSLRRSVQLQTEVTALLDRAVPAPATLDDWQDRHYALCEALANELATWLQWKNPGVKLPDQFVVTTAASFAAEMLVPFTVQAVRNLAVGERRH